MGTLLTQFQPEIVQPMNVSLPNKKEKKTWARERYVGKKTSQISVPALFEQRGTKHLIQRLKTPYTHVHTDKNSTRGKRQTSRFASKEKSISERESTLLCEASTGKNWKAGQAIQVGHAGRGKSTAQVEEDSFCTYSLSSSFGCEYAKSHVKQPQDTLYDDLQGASAETQDGGKRGPKKKHGLKTRRRSTTSFLCSNTFGAIGTQTHT